MTYFHTGTRTIIGADAFHCPVRDGKEWYHVAMVVRHKLFVWLTLSQPDQFIELISLSVTTPLVVDFECVNLA
jgi:hypothetical protein